MLERQKPHPRGIAIVIVLIFITVILSFAAGAATLTANSYRQIRQVVAANEAYYAAEGALEEALLALKDYGTGYGGDEADPTAFVNFVMQGTTGAEKEACDSQADADAENQKEGDIVLGDPEPEPVEDKEPGIAPAVPLDNCDTLSQNGGKAAEVSAQWKLIGFSPDAVNYKVQLDTNDVDAPYYSIPIAGTGNASDDLCDFGKTIPYKQGSSDTDVNTMKKFTKEYDAWVDQIAAENKLEPNLTAAYKIAEQNTPPAADHPCHWNRLYVSEASESGTVTIPLFRQFTNGNEIIVENPASTFVFDKDKNLTVETGDDAGLRFNENSKFFVRFRTPCKPVTLDDKTTVEIPFCNASQRYELDTSKEGEGDNTVVAWDISELEDNPCGQYNAVNGICSDDDKDPYKVKHSVGPLVVGPKEDDPQFNQDSNEIKESFINAAKNGNLTIVNDLEKVFPYQILNQTIRIKNLYKEILPKTPPPGYDSINPAYQLSRTIKNLFLGIDYYLFLNKKIKFSDWSDWRLFKPILRLNSLHTLQADQLDGGGNIPYLEYQVLSSTNFQPFSDAHQTIIAEGFSKGLKQTIQVKIPQSSSVLQYVIQQ